MSPEGLPLPVGCNCGCLSSTVAGMTLLLCTEACYIPVLTQCFCLPVFCRDSRWLVTGRTWCFGKTGLREQQHKP